MLFKWHKFWKTYEQSNQETSRQALIPMKELMYWIKRKQIYLGWTLALNHWLMKELTIWRTCTIKRPKSPRVLQKTLFREPSMFLMCISLYIGPLFIVDGLVKELRFLRWLSHLLSMLIRLAPLMGISHPMSNIAFIWPTDFSHGSVCMFLWLILHNKAFIMTIEKLDI